MKSSNPVEAHRREQRKKEVAKLKKDRDARKKAAADHATHLAESRTKLAQLDELAHSRPLTPAEKAQRKELRTLLADDESKKRPAGGGAGLRAVGADAVDEFGRSLANRGGAGAVPSAAVFDPLAESHASLLAKSSARALGASGSLPIPLTTYASSDDADGDSDDPNALDFDPPFPPLDEPKPPSYRMPPGQPVVKTMQGYPPPPMGPIPRHKPQMDPPGMTAGAVPPKGAVAGLPPKPNVGVGASGSSQAVDGGKDKEKSSAMPQVVISAAPVIRDRKAEMLRLAPESVRKRMEQQVDGGEKGGGGEAKEEEEEEEVGSVDPGDADAAYQAFMKEMEGLL